MSAEGTILPIGQQIGVLVALVWSCLSDAALLAVVRVTLRKLTKREPDMENFGRDCSVNGDLCVDALAVHEISRDNCPSNSCYFIAVQCIYRARGVHFS